MEVRRGRTRTERIKQPSCIAWFGAGQQVSNPATSTQQRVSLHPKGTKQATPKFGRNKRHHQYNGIFERSLFLSKAEKLVERLEFCKQVSGNRWIARCPAHDDRSPSLSITQVNDGRVLIHCHAGCGGNDILTSIGLQWADLYPDDDNFSPLVRRRERDSYNDLVVGIAEARVKEGHRLSEEDKRTVLQARLKQLYAN